MYMRRIDKRTHASTTGHAITFEAGQATFVPEIPQLVSELLAIGCQRCKEGEHIPVEALALSEDDLPLPEGFDTANPGATKADEDDLTGDELLSSAMNETGTEMADAGLAPATGGKGRKVK